ncbi:MAG: hypothetical protein ACLR8Y_01685 [Alistipes indistinctus]
MERLIARRYLTVGIVAGLFAVSLLVMGALPQNFFLNLDKPYFKADCFLPDGYNIRDTERNMAGIEAWLPPAVFGQERVGDDGRFAAPLLSGRVRRSGPSPILPIFWSN